MPKEMLINVSAGEECRIALLDNNKLEELYMERTSNTSHVGNIYKGKVTNVEPSIQAAFVDFGIGRNGFLHISDLMPSYFGKKGEHAPAEKVGQKLGRRDRPPIQQCLRKGDEIVVQIIKEGIGTKGPTLSTYVSIPGRVLVMMPGMAKMGVSKKIEDETERSRLRKILDGLTPPKDCGFIIRTAGIGKSKLEIERDLKYLARLWEQLKKQIDKDKPPVELYTEGDLITRTVRDVFTSDVDQIIVDDKETAKKIKDFIKLAMPRTKNKVELYEEVVPLFHKYELEDVIEGMYSRRVPLPSGGSLIIDQTEAVVAIDVNSGKFRDHSDAEETAFRTDLEAADEIPRQLRLRDMGGVIICDFIDLRYERHRRELEERLFENLKHDRAKTRMLRMSQFGIVEMTRQRMRPSLKRAIYQECPSCTGQGMVKTPESMALDVMRKLRLGLNDGAVVRALLTVHPDVATFLLNHKRYELAKLEQVTEKKVAVVPDAELASDEVKFELYDARDGYIYIAELGMALPSNQHPPRQAAPEGRGRGEGRRDGRGDGRRREAPKPKHDRRDDDSVDAEELFSDDAEGKPADQADAKPVGRSKAVPKTVPAEENLEETGNDDEAGVVDVDEGGDAMPGNAPDGFLEPGQRDPRDRGGDRSNRGRDRGRDRNRRPVRDRIENGVHVGDRGNDRNDRGPARNDRGPVREPNPAVGPVDEERDDADETEDGASEDAESNDTRAQARSGGRGGNGPRDDRDENAQGDLAESEAGDSDSDGERGENESEPGDQGVVGPNGEQQPREGGGRRRRRRGRRGRGRSTAGEAGGESGEARPSQGDNAEARPAADNQPRPQGDRNDGRRPPQGDPRTGGRGEGQGNDDRNGGGRSDARNDGRNDGRNEGRSDGRQEGRSDGRDRRPAQAERSDGRDRRPQPGRSDPRGGSAFRGDRNDRGGDRGPGFGGQQGRRGSSRADLSHLAREAARQDSAGHDSPVDAPVDEPEHDDDGDKPGPGNDINVEPRPARVEPPVRGRGGHRGGKPQRGRGPVAATRQPPLEGLPDDEELDREAAELEAQLAKAREAEATPHVTSPSVIVIPDIEPTGSSDKHLADDEPADGEDVKRPSSYTDLDALPDYEDD